MNRNEGRLKLSSLDPETQVQKVIPLKCLAFLWFIYFTIDSPCLISPPPSNSSHSSSLLSAGSLSPLSCFLTLLLPDIQRLDFSGIEPDVKPFEERFGRRIVVSCHDLTFSLQGCVNEKGDGVLTNVCHHLCSTTQLFCGLLLVLLLH